MIFVHDTRDKPGKHDNVDDFLTAQGHKIVRSKMYVGDVTLLQNQSVCIDLKQGLNEVESNLTAQHDRFKRECQKAQESGITLIVLIQNPRIKDLDGVKAWINPRRSRWDRINEKHARGQMLEHQISGRPPINGETMAKIMQTMTDTYGVKWEFSPKGKTGEKVCELLGVKIDPEKPTTNGRSSPELCVSVWQPHRFVSR